MSYERSESDIGIGAAQAFSLRVSVAALVRVLCQHPETGDSMLALERKATLVKTEKGLTVEVIAQPFGGAVRIRDLKMLQDQIGEFHFDSEESHAELDFRLFVRPSAWELIQRFCLQHLNTYEDRVIESDPRRELTEEFADALKISLKPDQYLLKPLGSIVEEHPAPTTNRNARGYLTVRIYRIFEARILDASLSRALLANSEGYSNQKLQELALEDAYNGGRGQANAILTVPAESLREFYLGISPEARNTPLLWETQQFDETVAVVLHGVTVPKYRML